MGAERLSMPLGEAMFSQRAIRRFTAQPISTEDIELMLEAASKAPNGGNSQIARFLVVRDPERIRQFGAIYRRAWWSKRKDDEGWSGPEDVPPGNTRHVSAMRLADEMQSVPCVIFALSVPPSYPESVFPSTQNLMLAARALGIGSVPTRLHPTVMDEFRALFRVPQEVTLHFAIPMGYPRGRFGATQRRPISETTFWETWAQGQTDAS